MKKIFVLAVFIFLLSSCAKSLPDLAEYKVFSSKEYREIPLTLLVDELSSCDVILLGEKHDSPFDHYLEYDLLKRISKKRSIVLSLEMFERDVQNILDSYLAGEITEDSFLAAARPWNNYASDYRNLLEFAKENKMPVVASNMPRSLASIVSKHGGDSLNSISDVKDFFVRPFMTPDDYKERFFDFFSSLMPGMEMAGMAKDNLFSSQLFKDATMAFSINKALSDNPGSLVFMVCGEFHSDYYQGVYQQLSAINPNLKIASISVPFDSSDFDPSRADYLILK